MRWLLPALLAAIACGPATNPADDRIIVPGERVGAITAATGLAQLRTIYGASNVRVTDLDVGEGETERGAVIFPDDPLRRVAVTWADTAAHTPHRIVIRGDSSAWHTDSGVTLGTPLSRLAQLNGRPFILLGFGWDYAGTVVSWDSGGMDVPAPGGRLLLRLAPAVATPHTDSLTAAVRGDREYRSDNPAMQALDPAVYEMVTLFEPARP